MAQARTGSKEVKESPKVRFWERPILWVTKLSQWWVLPFFVSTICVVLLQVGPRPLHTAIWGSAGQEQAADKQAPKTSGQTEQPRCTIWANPQAAGEKKTGKDEAPGELQTPGYRQEA